MTEDRKETPGMAEVSAKFEPEAEAAARNIQDAINAALGKILPYSVDETDIAYIYRKLLAVRAGRPSGLSEDDLAAWTDYQDSIEGAIGRLEARNTQDVDIKLAVLCDRLRKAEANDLLMAQAARDDLKKLLITPSPASVSDDSLMALAADYYAAYKAYDAAWAARDEAEGMARREDISAFDGGPDLGIGHLFEQVGNCAPTKTEIQEYTRGARAVKAEDVIIHLGKFGKRCRAAYEAQGWPEKHAEVARTKARKEAIFDRMLGIPAQGLRGIAAKVKGLVYPHEWEFLRDGDLDNFDDQINTDMLVSLVADVERLSNGTLAIGCASTTEDPVLVLKREWEARYKALDEHRDDPDADDSDEAVQPFYDRLRETEVEILRTQATTLAGIAVKLILWARLHCGADEVSGLSWIRKSIKGEPFDLDRLPVLSALLDLERISSGAIAPEPPAAAASSTSDPVAQIGRDLAATWRQVWRNDEEERPPADAPVAQKTRFMRVEYRLSDRWATLESMAAEVPATTLEGAMVQIMLAHAAADLMMADGAEETAAVQMRTISKLLYSALAVIEQVAGVPREELGGGHYMCRDLDPHALVAGEAQS